MLRAALVTAFALGACGPAAPPRSPASLQDGPGAPEWTRLLAGDGHPSAHDLAAGDDGAVVVVGAFSGRLAAGDTELRAGGADDDAFAVALTPGGDVRWARAFGGPGVDAARAVAIAPGGEIVVAGSFRGTLAVGATTLAATTGPDLFVARLSAAGEPLWAHAFAGPGVAQVQDLALDAAGDIVLAGFFDETLALGELALDSEGMQDGFVARLSPAGEPRWARTFGGPSTDAIEAVAIGAGGDIVITGYFRQRVALGDRELTTTGDKTDGLLASLRAADGAPQWAQRFGGRGHDAGYAVAVDAAGAIAFAATFDEPLMVGSGPLAPLGDFDVLLGKVTAAGDHVWTRRLGGEGNEAVAHLATTGEKIIVSGDFEGTPALGELTLSAAGRHDGFVAAFDAAGEPRWARAFGGEGQDQLGAVEAAADGGIVTVGAFHGAADIAGRHLVAPDGYALVVMRLAP